MFSSVPKNMKIIGLVGLKGAGKSVVADAIVEQEGWQKRAFAGPLKDGLIAFFGLTQAQMHDAKLKEEVDPRYGVTPRELMQVVGTDLIRNQLSLKLPHFRCESLWIARMDEVLSAAKVLGVSVVVEDVRFPNEVECIRKHGGSLVMVARPAAAAASAEKAQHETESYIAALPYDTLLVNSGTRQELRDKALDLLK